MVMELKAGIWGGGVCRFLLDAEVEEVSAILRTIAEDIPVRAIVFLLTMEAS
jgi:hypothetical protein